MSPVQHSGAVGVRREGDGLVITLVGATDSLAIALGHSDALGLVRQLLDVLDEVEDARDAAAVVGSDGELSCPGLRLD